MNVKEIITEWLKSHGYDGLYSEDCGCAIEELFVCEGDMGFDCGLCAPGYKRQDPTGECKYLIGEEREEVTNGDK